MGPDASIAELSRLGGVVLAAAAGSMMNSVAGGGTLLTFPSLVALGVPPLVANATSTVALWPGGIGSILGYRDRLAGTRMWAAIFAIPSLVGGGFGAWLLLSTPADAFAAIVPWLVFGATALFALGSRARPRPGGGPLPSHSVGGLLCQLAVGIYGGYFGAGIGILMLAVLGFMGFSDIHQMNGLKNWGALCINFVAACLFIVSGIVNWPVAIAMAVGALIGGYLASRIALRVPAHAVRRAVVVIGLSSGLWLLRL